MDFIFTIFFAFSFLILSAIQGYFIGYPLILLLILVSIVLVRRGFSFQALLRMGLSGSKKSFSVFSILLLIGAVTAIWMAAGTVPALVYYGIQFINPKYFIAAAFILTSLVSLLLGTSFGTVSTIGIALVIMSNGSGVNHQLIAGAIIAGAYVGDRCSPMSSSANLIAAITKTNLYTNIKNMWFTAVVPLLVSVFLYGILSWLNPVQMTDQSFVLEIRQAFNINWISLLPAITILLLSLLQVEVKLSMVTSAVVAVAIAFFMQHYTLPELIKFMLFGFQLEKSSPLNSILLGGGVLSMVKVSIVVIISTAFVGIFAGTRILENLEIFSKQSHSRSDHFLSTLLIGIGSAAFGCTQTIAILLTQELVEQQYKKKPKGRDKLALDLENTVVVVAPLIPWNIAGLVPATILMTGPGFIPFAFYLYLLPLFNLIQIKLSSPPRKPAGKDDRQGDEQHFNIGDSTERSKLQPSELIP